ncbi:MAG: GNAT family N-acetyltransferase [Pseudomonadota bacterium]
MTEPAIRNAAPSDAHVCAAIHHAWIESTSWMPKLHTLEDVQQFYSDHVWPNTRVFVAGDPPKAYLALDKEDCVTALYSALPGKGLGKALLDHAKGLTRALSLWTFVANTGAQRFYEREGFKAVGRTEGENDEGLPDILYRWEARDA